MCILFRSMSAGLESGAGCAVKTLREYLRLKGGSFSVQDVNVALALSPKGHCCLCSLFWASVNCVYKNKMAVTL